MEHIVYHHIMNHLEIHNILSNNQHGFRRHHSCETQLVSTIETIARSLDNGKQIDLLVLDFAKAFDTVAHERLLLKLGNYGVSGALNSWIRVWLTQRTQQVVVEGESSDERQVKSGVPQGTVLGPLMFLLFINDIGDGINSQLRLFADDSLLFKTINNDNDANQLQKDLDQLISWSKKWQMSFNPTKCNTLRITKKKRPIQQRYSMLGHTLQEVDTASYLGVELSSTLSWDNHVNKITAKANRTLGFVKRNLGKCPSNIKAQAYQALVRPHLEYTSSAWDPYTSKHKSQIEMVQRRAARFVTSTYSKEPGTVTKILKDLEWPTLEKRREVSRLTLMYKLLHGQAAIQLPTYIQRLSPRTRLYHPERFRQMTTHKEVYQASFFPRTIVNWNALPVELLEAHTLEAFKGGLSRQLLCV